MSEDINYNTGNWNTGKWNSGNWNTRHWNVGNWNIGYRNTGHWNAGDWNVGNFNTGDWNTGDYNTGDYNTGYCNSITPDECFIFNKPGLRSDWEEAAKPDWMFVSLTKWIPAKEMSDEEKKNNPSYETTDGYLKAYNSLTEAYKESWDNATEDDRELTRHLPNFDEYEFEKVFGFNPWKKKGGEVCD